MSDTKGGERERERERGRERERKREGGGNKGEGGEREKQDKPLSTSVPSSQHVFYLLPPCT